jgi:hypothetical protein
MSGKHLPIPQSSSGGFRLKRESLRERIEGTPGKLEVQIWLSAFGIPPYQLQEFGSRWTKCLEELVGMQKAFQVHFRDADLLHGIHGRSSSKE